MKWSPGPYIPLAASILSVLAFIAQSQLYYFLPSARVNLLAPDLVNRTSLLYEVGEPLKRLFHQLFFSPTTTKYFFSCIINKKNS